MTKRAFNFSAGPCILPLPVLEKAAAELVDYQGSGMSLIEMSHRGKHYEEVHRTATNLVRELLGVPETHDILLLQGGATLQFAMIPANLKQDGKVAEFVHTGHWAKAAIADAKKITETRIVWNGESDKYTRMPKASELKAGADAAYFHVTTNETIGGIETVDFPSTGDVPLVADMSSHIMSRPIDVSKFGLIYAGAQKNMGPAGLAVVIVRKDLLERTTDKVPAYMSYKVHAGAESLYNTPPVFTIYMMKLTLEWVKANGGLKGMEALALKRAGAIYDVIDGSNGWFKCPVDKASRSRMNVVFRLPTEDLEKEFLSLAEKSAMTQLKGHRSVGGCRASMYNAMPVEGATTLAQFMVDFQKKHA